VELLKAKKTQPIEENTQTEYHINMAETTMIVYNVLETDCLFAAGEVPNECAGIKENSESGEEKYHHRRVLRESGASGRIPFLS
jgi:hypothetical protein